MERLDVKNFAEKGSYMLGESWRLFVKVSRLFIVSRQQRRDAGSSDFLRTSRQL